jgi:hypothetical protein
MYSVLEVICSSSTRWIVLSFFGSDTWIYLSWGREEGATDEIGEETSVLGIDDYDILSVFKFVNAFFHMCILSFKSSRELQEWECDEQELLFSL